MFQSTPNQTNTFIGVVHNPEMDSFGDRIRSLRKSRDLTQEEVARALGVKQGSYTQLERGTSKSASAKNLLALAAFYEVNPFWLLDGKGERNPLSTYTSEESEMLLLYRDLSPEGKEYILRRTQSVHSDEHARRPAPTGYLHDRRAPKKPEQAN